MKVDPQGKGEGGRGDVGGDGGVACFEQVFHEGGLANLECT